MALSPHPIRTPTEDPFAAFKFVVFVRGLETGGFTEVTGLQSEVEVFDYREGGRNDYVRRFAGPARYPSNLALRRGLSDPFMWEWHQLVLRGQVRRLPVSVRLRDTSRGEVWTWAFREAYPVRWSGPELRASTSAVAVEAVEFAHEGLELRESGSRG